MIEGQFLWKILYKRLGYMCENECNTYAFPRFLHFNLLDLYVLIFPSKFRFILFKIKTLCNFERTKLVVYGKMYFLAIFQKNQY